jgi:hypothetical protein
MRGEVVATIGSARYYLANTLTMPSPPAETTRRPSWLQTTLHTPSPRMMRCAVISCVHMRLSSDQNRIEASCPADTASRPSLLSDNEEIAAGCASMLYVHCPVPGQQRSNLSFWENIPELASKNLMRWSSCPLIITPSRPPLAEPVGPCMPSSSEPPRPASCDALSRYCELVTTDVIPVAGVPS